MPPRPPLDAARLSTAPWPVEVVAQAGSTNAILLERARAGAEPQVLVTEHQTAGRGRLARTWETPDRAALTFSVLLRPRASAERWSWLPLIVGLAVHRALASVLSDEDRRAGRVTLKWPNDVLIDDRKVAGILVERVESAVGPAAIVGVGLNVSQSADELPVPTATSLALAGLGPVDRTDLLRGVLAHLHGLVSTWDDPEPPAVPEGEWVFAVEPIDIRADYVGVCSTLGRDVRVDLPGGQTLTGRATDIDEHGRLVVQTAADDRRTVGAGDVVHVRSPG